MDEESLHLRLCTSFDDHRSTLDQERLQVEAGGVGEMCTRGTEKPKSDTGQVKYMAQHRTSPVKSLDSFSIGTRPSNVSVRQRARASLVSEQTASEKRERCGIYELNIATTQSQKGWILFARSCNLCHFVD